MARWISMESRLKTIVRNSNIIWLVGNFYSNVISVRRLEYNGIEKFISINTCFSSVFQPVGRKTWKQNAISFNESRKMWATNSLRYLRSMFILFINISIYLKVLKNTLSPMKLKIEILKMRSQRKPMSNLVSQII